MIFCCLAERKVKPAKEEVVLDEDESSSDVSLRSDDSCLIEVTLNSPNFLPLHSELSSIDV